ncbi:MAG: hypothetical protein AAF514_09905, partial [Verrucomicrobiota bacterium]
RPNNYYTIFNRKRPDGFKYFEHDSEHSLDKGDEDMTEPFTPTRCSARNFNPHWLHEQLVENELYVKAFSDRSKELLLEEGALTAKASIARLDKRFREVDKAMIAHSARWGDARSSRPRTYKDWLEAVDEIRQWMRVRNPIVLNQFRRLGWYQGSLPPEFNLRGEDVPSGFPVHFEGTGDFYYTLDGSDPRKEDGGIHPSAILGIAPVRSSVQLVRTGAPLVAMVPKNGRLGRRWIEPSFDDSSWRKGRSGIGFDTKWDYQRWIKLDFEVEMNGPLQPSAYLRLPFQVEDPESVSLLVLRMKYDDGFIAYLNGREVASGNAPLNPSWNSSASQDNPDDSAQRFENFPLEGGGALLEKGRNVLAIHGMNGSLPSSDFLILPELQSVAYRRADPLDLPDGTTVVKARSYRHGEWSPLATRTFRR